MPFSPRHISLAGPPGRTAHDGRGAAGPVSERAGEEGRGSAG